MFDGFQKETDEQARKRLFASTGVSVVLCVLAGVALIVLARQPKPKKKQAPIEVSFKAPPKPEARPEPRPEPPKPQPKKTAPRKSTGKKVAKSAPSVPTEIPDEALAEGDAADFESDGEIPDSIGAGGVAQADPEPPPPVIVEPSGPRGPIVMPEKAIPPRPRNTNRAPVYPEKARKQGIEGMVILKVVISEDGEVENVQVLRGEEPFVGAALAVVQDWRYAPAVIEGEKTSVYRIIKVPFRLSRS